MKIALCGMFILFLCTSIACDFDVPDRFDMPVWNLDLIPLVNAKYEMSDILT